MLIIFGIRRFILMRIHPSELGMSDASWNGSMIVAIQRYFHLMYIPFFPVGKVWAIQNPNGSLYEATPQIQAHMIAKGHHINTPWYAFAGLFLIGVIFVFAMISAAVGSI